MPAQTSFFPLLLRTVRPLPASRSPRSAQILSIPLLETIMPAFKATTINASLFPDGETAEDETVEHAPGGTAPSSRKWWGLKKTAKTRPTQRNLGDEGEERADEKTPPSTQPSTRRSSLTTAVNAEVRLGLEFVSTLTSFLLTLVLQDSLNPDKAEKGQTSDESHAKGHDVYDKNKIVLVQFEDGDPENPLNWSRARKWVIVRTPLASLLPRLIFRLTPLPMY